MFLEQFPVDGRTNGWIEVICGSMFSGKTEELIRRIRRAEFANQALILFKPMLDNRYSEKHVVSHKGTSFEAVIVNESKEILMENEKIWFNKMEKNNKNYISIWWYECDGKKYTSFVEVMFLKLIYGKTIRLINETSFSN